MSRFSAKLAAQQDTSLGELMSLRDQGYTTIVWQQSWAPCMKCRGLHGQAWDINAFITGLAHSAPIFEHSHVNCRCTLLVKNPETGDEFEVVPF